MIFELGAFLTLGSGVLIGADLFGKKKSDEKKLEELFLNAGVKAGDKYPKLIDKIPHDWGTEFVYKLPIGIPYKLIEKISPMINDTLNKEVETSYNGVLHIRVPDTPIPKKVAYTDVIDHVRGWEIPIGVGSFGLVKHDFDKVPHMCIGGLTRYGKTILLKLITTTLIRNNPDYVQNFYFDLKGGLEFNQYEKLKQTVAVASNAKQSLKYLREIKGDIEKRLDYFKSNGITNIVDTNMKERIFIIVDEGAQLAPAKTGDKATNKILTECQSILSFIAQMGGGLGYRLIFCTQYPTGDTLPRQVKQNADAKIAFRVPTRVASDVCLDAYGAEELPHALPGRAIFKTDRLQTIQVPYDNDFYKYVSEYEVKHEQPREKQATRESNIIEFG